MAGHRNSTGMSSAFAWGIALLAAAVPEGFAQSAPPPFALREQPSLEATWRGAPFLVGDEFNLGSGAPVPKPSFHAVAKEGVSAVNVLAKGEGDVRYRREAAVHPDGSLEVTARIQVLPWQEGPKRVVSWSLKVSAKALDGAKFHAMTNKKSAPGQPMEGQVSAGGPDVVLASQCRYISFSRGNSACTFDLDPYGASAWQHFMKYGGPIGAWTVRKQGDAVVFSFAGNVRFCGGVYTGKLRVFDGNRPYRELHPYEEWSYVGATPVQQQFSFGTTAGHLRGFVKADLLLFTAERKWGWEKAEGLEAVAVEPADIAANCVSCVKPGPNAFKLSVPRAGHYVVTVRVGHPHLDLGPFDVRVNGHPSASGVRVKAGESRTLVFACAATEPSPSIAVGFEGSGPWAIRSLVVQPIVYANEDFSIHRGLWVVDTLDPLDLAFPLP